jgi:hypothetical protein
MAEDFMRYDRLVEDAMRGVVRAALERTAEEGLPGEHHFYITFLTGADGVTIPGFLRERYPDEMTIVLQHRFSDLEVGQDGFGVTLTFNEVPARLLVPFEALTAFADPSVRFGFTFAHGQDAGEDDDDAEDAAGETPAALAERDGPAGTAEEAETAAGAEAGPDAGRETATEAGETVVSLDRFRKNKG